MDNDIDKNVISFYYSVHLYQLWIYVALFSIYCYIFV